jgi:hypothetical protein
MNSVSMLSMPADWTTPGGSNPEHRCTPPISMLKACGRHFRRHAANARPIGPPRPKAPATLPIRRKERCASRISGLAKAATMLAVNLLGDRLRDALDPRTANGL